MADNNTTANNGTAGQGTGDVPSWLKKAQEVNKIYDQPAGAETSAVTPASAGTASVAGLTTPAAASAGQSAADNSLLKQVVALKEHEEKASFDDEGKQVLPNVSGSAEEVALKKEEKNLAGLKFEGVEDTAETGVAAIQTAVPVAKAATAVTPARAAPLAGNTAEAADTAAVPDWLKNLKETPVTTTEEKKQTSQIQNELIKSLENKPEEKLPIAADKEKKAPENKPESSKAVAPAVAAAQEKSAAVTAADAKKEAAVAQEKANLLKDLTKGLSGFFKTAKEEVKKGKSAGVEEAEITLENFEMNKAARQYAKTTVGQKQEKEVADEHRQLLEAEKVFQEGMATVRDLISPASMEISYDNLRVEGLYARTFLVYSYPRYLDTNWMSPIVNFDATMDIAQFIYPIDSAKIMRILSKKVTQMQSAMNLNAEKGMIRDPALETAYEDAEQLRTEIQRGQEKFFQFAMYITIYADELKKIDRISKQLESILGSKLILTKRADLRMEHGFNSTTPLCLDELEIIRNMNTGPLSTTFPFSSSDLTSNEGVLYGLNRHNDSLVIFDRFSLPNANSVVFAISGAGKSYSVKLEIVRYLMLGVDVIVIDPENEYEELAKTVGGSYLRVSLTSDRRINPFDLPAPLKDEELQPGDLLRANIINLHGLLKIMLQGLTPAEEGLIDKALNDVYALKGITMEIIDPSNMPVPTMEDLHALLMNMEGGIDLAQRLEKFTKGTYSGIFNKPTNVDVKSGLMVFSIRDLEDALRPIAMYIILNFIWNKIRSQLKKRLMIVDEAWTMMQHEDSARFLFGLVKRARKYYLGITVINQDVEDFMKSPYGKPIVSNSAMALLLKQSPASIAVLQKTFNLTEGEKYMLLNSGVGQGLFFAGMKHVAMQIIASYTEDKIVTTNPEEILRGLSTQTTETYE